MMFPPLRGTALTSAGATIDDTPTDRDFTITPTGLVSGDELDVRLTLVIEDGGVDATGEIEAVSILLDVKG